MKLFLDCWNVGYIMSSTNQTTVNPLPTSHLSISFKHTHVKKFNLMKLCYFLTDLAPKKSISTYIS